MYASCLHFLLGLLVIQMIIIYTLYGRVHHFKSIVIQHKIDELKLQISKIQAPVENDSKQQNHELDQSISIRTQETTGPLDGVAVCLLLHAPTWFQRRYSMMIQNALNNIPASWKVQIFYTPKGQSLNGLVINPGISKLVEQGRVVLTRIPDEITKHKRKRYELMLEPWVWRAMLGNKVLIFGGNSVICSNSPYRVTNFTHFDYIGAPWPHKGGAGGDGSISLRTRDSMLVVLQTELDKIGDDEQKLSAHKSWGQEDVFFVTRLLQMPGQHVAKPEDTQRFAASDRTLNAQVLAVSGTLPGVAQEEREQFVKQCPEVKMFYPVLHNPACFGASPDGQLCAATVCALKPNDQRKGGC